MGSGPQQWAPSPRSGQAGQGYLGSHCVLNTMLGWCQVMHCHPGIVGKRLVLRQPCLLDT